MVYRLRRNGGSIIMVVPSFIAQELNLESGDDVEIKLHAEGFFTVKKATKKTLDDMLAECDLSAPIDNDEDFT